MPFAIICSVYMFKTFSVKLPLASESFVVVAWPSSAASVGIVPAAALWPPDAAGVAVAGTVAAGFVAL